MKRILWLSLLLAGCSTIPPAPAPVRAVPVLMYHRIVPDGSQVDEMRVTISDFKQQLAWLKKNGYVTITASQMIDWYYDSNYLAITFDDGWLDQLDAVKALREQGMTATFFIIGRGSIQPEMYLNWEQIKQLSEDFEIGGHSMTHPDTITQEQVTQELLESKHLIERSINRQVKTIAWPNGYYSPQLIEAAKRYGYSGAFTIEQAWPDGHVGNRQSDDRFLIKRIFIDGRCDLSEFGQIVTEMHTVRCVHK